MEGFARDCFGEFLSSTPQSNGNILSVSELGATKRKGGGEGAEGQLEVCGCVSKLCVE